MSDDNGIAIAKQHLSISTKPLMPPFPQETQKSKMTEHNLVPVERKILTLSLLRKEVAFGGSLLLRQKIVHHKSMFLMEG